MNEYLWPLLFSAALAVAGLAGHWLAVRLMRRITDRTATDTDDQLLSHLVRPTRLMALLLGLSLGFTLLPHGALALVLKKTATLCWIGIIAWVFISLILASELIMVERFSARQVSSLNYRK
ncbi:MAG: hypothetical protein ACOCVM_08380, partial [Desulfovibrionaceae bacterium]